MHPTPQLPACQGRGVWVWCPENLDVDRLLNSWDRRTREGVLWLGHSIYTSLADDARCRETGRVPLKTEYLRAVIGRHHLDAVREAARQIGYVDRDGSYRAGIRSQAYRILPPHDRAHLVQRQITDVALRHNILTWREARHREMWQRIRHNETPVSEAVCAHLWRNLQRIQLDAHVDFLEAFHPAYQIAAERIRQGELWLIVDDYGRVHTNVSNLSKRLRPYLSVEGNRLANVDISESQPLFVGIALATARSRKQPRRERKGARQPANQEATRQPPPATPLMMDNTYVGQEWLTWGGFDRKRLPEDLFRYLELCESRALYESVANRLGKTREEAKRGVMVAFYDKPWHVNAVSAVLEQLFPTVMQAMRQVKRQDYRRLAHLAQRIESGFMFGRVVPRLMELHPDLFVSTIHDSVLTTAGDASFVRELMLEEFAQLGVSPQVRVELCAPNENPSGAP